MDVLWKDNVGSRTKLSRIPQEWLYGTWYSTKYPEAAIVPLQLSQGSGFDLPDQVGPRLGFKASDGFQYT